MVKGSSISVHDLRKDVGLSRPAQSIFGMLLFRPKLEAKFFPSQIKMEIILLHLAKAL